jgi:uncharacterized membrane protein
MPDAIEVLTIVTAVGCGLSAGVLFGFSTFVMPALATLSASQGIGSMNAINVKAINPPFMVALFGSALASIGLAAAGLARLDEPWAPYLVAAAVVYVLGTPGVTMWFNVPRNNALATADADSPEGARYWGRYLVEWTRWNHVRVAAGTLAAGLLIAAVAAG